MASLHLNAAAVSSLAERIAQARRLYGSDSAYVIGLFAGLEWVFEGGDGESTRRQIQDRVLELEGSKAGGPTPTAPSRAPTEATGRGRGEGLAENSWIRGVVKWFNNDKGYGFISTAADTDVFVHWRDISSWDRSLTQGDDVEFMVTKTAKGFQAINVMKPGATGKAATDGSASAVDPGAAPASEVPAAADDFEAGGADGHPAVSEGTHDEAPTADESSAAASQAPTP